MKAGRKLHLEQAADVLDPDAGQDVIASAASPIINERIVSSEFFDLRVTENNDQIVHRQTENASFHCLTMIEGGE